jgi:hypothetical protein
VATDWPWLILVLLLAALVRLARPACAFASAQAQYLAYVPGRLCLSRLVHGFATVWMADPSTECRIAFRGMVKAKPSTWPRGWIPPRTVCLDLSTWLRVNWPTAILRLRRLRSMESLRQCRGVGTGETACLIVRASPDRVPGAGLAGLCFDLESV